MKGAGLSRLSRAPFEAPRSGPACSPAECSEKRVRVTALSQGAVVTRSSAPWGTMAPRLRRATSNHGQTRTEVRSLQGRTCIS